MMVYVVAYDDGDYATVDKFLWIEDCA